MTRGNQIAAGVFTLLGLAAVILSLPLGYYTPQGPGPGFFPLWIAIALTGVSGAYFVRLTVPRFAGTARAPKADPVTVEPATDEPAVHGSLATAAVHGDPLAMFVHEESVDDEPEEPIWPGRAAAIRVGIVLAAVLYVSITIEWLGFQLSMCTMLATVLLTLGKQKLWVTGIISLVGSFGVFFLFTQVLHVQLPVSGILWFAAIGL